MSLSLSFRKREYTLTESKRKNPAMEGGRVTHELSNLAHHVVLRPRKGLGYIAGVPNQFDSMIKRVVKCSRAYYAKH